MTTVEGKKNPEVTFKGVRDRRFSFRAQASIIVISLRVSQDPVKGGQLLGLYVFCGACQGLDWKSYSFTRFRYKSSDPMKV